jgi:hypothetical protein
VKTEFKELRGTTVENLMFIKEDVIIPLVSLARMQFGDSV